MSSSLSVHDLVLERHGVELARDINFDLADGQRMAVVGPNGCGKSTLLGVVAEALPVESGSLDLHGNSVGVLDQMPGLGQSESISSWISDRVGVTAATEKMEKAASALTISDSAETAEVYDKALKSWLTLGGTDLEERLERILAEMHLEVPLEQRVGELSGGQRAKVGLAAILLSRFDVLCVDEPTNNLDEDSLVWLEEFLLRRKGPLLVVSHDRVLLTEISTHVLEFDPALERVQMFSGGYDAWRSERQRDLDAAQGDFDEYQSQRQELKSQADRVRRSAARGISTAKRKKSKGENPDHRVYGANLEGATANASKARDLERRANKLEEKREPRKQWQLRIAFPVADTDPRVLVTAASATVIRGSRHIGPLSCTIGHGDRIAVSGPNGSGKSTIVKMLSGELPPDSGEISIPHPELVAVLDQDRQLPTADNLFAAAESMIPDLASAELRSLLAKFGLGRDDLSKTPDVLSWGERTRLILATITQQPTRLLILDEPTNHLDLLAVEQIESALAEYQGAMIVVTHDRQLQQMLSFDRRWQVDHDGVFQDLDSS